MRATGIERDFGGEVRKFDISPIGAWRAVEARCGVGIGRVLARLYTGMSQPQGFDVYGDDIREVLFQGLKGGGMPDAEASKLIRTHFDQAGGKGQFCSLALEIVSAFWLGAPEGNEPAPQTESEATMAPAASTSAPSMEPVQPSGSRRGKSTK